MQSNTTFLHIPNLGMILWHYLQLQTLIHVGEVLKEQRPQYKRHLQFYVPMKNLLDSDPHYKSNTSTTNNNDNKNNNNNSCDNSSTNDNDTKDNDDPTKNNDIDTSIISKYEELERYRDQHLCAVVKATASGLELYLQTIHYTGDSERRRARQKGKLIQSPLYVQ